MTAGGLKRVLTTSLRTRIALLMLAGFLAVSVPAYGAFVWIVNTTVVSLGTLFAEKQILFDRYRGLGALMREVSLAETLARSPTVRDWAFDESDPQKMRRGIAELEHYRQAFADKSYFFVVGASGNYYFNDAANSYAGNQYSYTLDPDNPRDGWYYKTAALGEGCHLNVDNDDTLRVTKVWMNCVIREGARVLGIVGTGLDLTSFIREVVDIPQTGVQSMFVDRSGALQAHRDPRLVDFQSLTKDISNKKTIFNLIDRPQDGALLSRLMTEVTSGDVLVRSAFMQVDGRQTLVGVGYLDRLGWYNITFMDVDEIIDRDLFLPIGLLLGAMMLAVTLVLALVIKRMVIDRVEAVEAGVAAVRAGVYRPELQDRGADEIGRLSRAFGEMASAVSMNTQMLETVVDERTRQLQDLANLDQLTAIPNRRGFVSAFETASLGARSERLSPALLLIDVDRFKQINDSHGHQAGDLVLVEVARRLGAIVRPEDVCGRWGGDEFIVLIADVGTLGLRAIAGAIAQALSGAPYPLQAETALHIGFSIGACLVEPGEGIDAAADRADAALYRAKADGRGRVVVEDGMRARRAAG
ncbi:diguanylate cyclase [Arsenicitalea aurantiaca]|uniref:diguanylate cyclase n=1 Tax=Arsenicitalea aurantiaca TaxID=1783274 RepID=A0A433XK74_9HYPH|nr:diguanylate cyclase [Arsenicitalea aurantiaca]RUT34418.1 diguanylate cyclase [Arsenicitalea aurantiaca]